MTSLTEFLSARLDEDEALAKVCLRYQVLVDQGEWSTERARQFGVQGYVDQNRAYAQVEALRAVVALCEDILRVDGWEYTDTPTLAEDTLRTLAQPYRDHPDFNPSWVV